jgi:hypothetical protein
MDICCADASAHRLFISASYALNLYSCTNPSKISWSDQGAHNNLTKVHTTCRMLIQGFTLCVQSATDIGDMQGYSARVCTLLDVLDARETTCQNAAQAGSADLETLCDKADNTDDLGQARTSEFSENLESAQLCTRIHTIEDQNGTIHTLDTFRTDASDFSVAQTPSSSLPGEPFNGGSQVQGLLSHGIQVGKGDTSQHRGGSRGDKHLHTLSHDHTAAQKPRRATSASRHTCQTDTEEGLCVRDLTIRTPSGAQLICG